MERSKGREVACKGAKEGRLHGREERKGGCMEGREGKGGCMEGSEGREVASKHSKQNNNRSEEAAAHPLKLHLVFIGSLGVLVKRNYCRPQGLQTHS